jgi:four helix bundle protein
MAGSYKELRAWKLGVDLVLEVYRETQRFPKAELYGLTNQIRRAAVSVPSNIAEGKGRSSDREFALFLRHARGSLLELETQLLIAGELGYLPPERADSLSAQTEQLAKTLNALLNVVKDDPPNRKETKRQEVGTSATSQRPSAIS